MIVYREIGTTTWLAREPMFTFGFEYAPAVKVFDQLDKKYQKKLRECEFKIVNEWALKLNEERDRTGKLELDEGNPFKAVMLPLGFKEIDGQYDPKDVAYIRKLMEATMIAATLINLLKSE
jgi:hypothetical protein